MPLADLASGHQRGPKGDLRLDRRRIGIQRSPGEALCRSSIERGLGPLRGVHQDLRGHASARIEGPGRGPQDVVAPAHAGLLESSRELGVHRTRRALGNVRSQCLAVGGVHEADLDPAARAAGLQQPLALQLRNRGDVHQPLQRAEADPPRNRNDLEGMERVVVEAAETGAHDLQQSGRASEGLAVNPDPVVIDECAGLHAVCDDLAQHEWIALANPKELAASRSAHRSPEGDARQPLDRLPVEGRQLDALGHVLLPNASDSLGDRPVVSHSEKDPDCRLARELHHQYR